MSVYVSGTLAPLGGGPFACTDTPTHLGGWHEFATIAARNAFVSSFPLRCEQGMAALCYDTNPVTLWSLNAPGAGWAGTNADWTALPTGSGSGTVTSVSWTGDGTIFTASADTPVTTSGTLTPASLIAQTAHYVLAGPASAGPTVPTFRAMAGADLPAIGLTITQWTGGIITANPAAGTATLNLAAANRFSCTLVNGTPTTLAISSPAVGQQFSVLLIQDATGSCTVGTWFTGIKWAGGSAPTLTTTASKGDLVTFLCVSTGVYWGMIAGQNF